MVLNWGLSFLCIIVPIWTWWPANSYLNLYFSHTKILFSLRVRACAKSHALEWATADTRHEQKLFMVHGCSHKSMSERKIERKEEMKRVEKNDEKIKKKLWEKERKKNTKYTRTHMFNDHFERHNTNNNYKNFNF